MSHSDNIYNTFLVFKRDENHFLRLYQESLIYMQIHTATFSHLQNGGIPIFICKSSLEEITEFYLELCQAMQVM